MTSATTARDPRPAVSVGTSLAQQAWLIAVSGRWTWFTLVLVLAVALVAAAELAQSAPAVVVAWLALLPVGAVWAVRVWAGEEPERRSYHWSLPVWRPAHDLARVTAGAVYLLLAYGVMAVAGALVAARTGSYDVLAAVPRSAWVTFFAAPLIIYFLVTPLVLWDFRVTRWALGAFTAVGMLAVLVNPLGEAMHALLFAEGRGLAPALLDGMLTVFFPPVHAAPWWVATALWLTGAVAVTVFTAWFRPDDVRRLLR